MPSCSLWKGRNWRTGKVAIDRSRIGFDSYHPVYMYMYVIYIYICMYIYIRIFIFMCIHIWRGRNWRTGKVAIDMSRIGFDSYHPIYIYICIYGYAYICIKVYKYVYIYIHIYIWRGRNWRTGKAAIDRNHIEIDSYHPIYI
jgi:hypothetical protein